MDGRWLTAAALLATLGASAARRGSRSLTPGSRAGDLGQAFQKQFRGAWDADAWEAIVRGPVAQLARALDRTGEDHATSDDTLDAVLRLLGEAQGHGYFAHELFRQIWLERVPKELAQVAPSRRFTLLADLWNKSEALVRSPRWKVEVFAHEVTLDGVPLEAIANRLVLGDELLDSDAGLVLSSSSMVVHWLSFSDPTFLPGDLYLKHPRLVIVSDRLSSRAEAVWLSATEGPVSVGAFKNPPARPALATGKDLWKAIAEKDPAVTTRHHSVATRVWSAATLVTSRYLLCAVPEAK